ncbi:Protein of unknown function [Persephonella hydrogeniphila]|uniref:DUF445 domain-containing protein n=1 Tax=Persephonella hydrogeniphila TaxID=198703 RepID=A0A285MZE7_9AQUI|nr:DUF445 family protein [Persephonella hydrogeniphila]SNZ02569.1 Protein of unknown function [Persephonella hydrogeniphila]
MENLLHYILPPVLGAFIGYITNYLAIKMLFRPFKEKRVFGIKIPFTPGLIPKRREEIAVAIAKTIEQHLLTKEKLHRLFEESGYKDRLKARIEIILDQMIDEIFSDIQTALREGVSLGKLNIKTTVIAVAFEKFIEKAGDKIKEKLKNKMLEKASDSIEKNIEEELPIILSQLNIRKMVVDTFMDMDIETLEKIVLGFSEKQLKHITYTGAVLGFLIGAFQTVYLLLT